MAWSHLQTTAADSGASTNVLAYGSNLGANSLLVCSIVWPSAIAFTSIVNSNGVSWVPVGTEQTNSAGSFPFKQRVYYALNVSAGANTVTSTIASAPAFHELYICEYSGIATASPLDATNEGVQNTSYSLSATAGAANELLWGFAQGATTTSVLTAPSGWNTRSSFDGLVVDNVSASGSNAMTMGAGTNGDVALVLAIFKLPAAGGRGLFRTPPVSGIGVGGSFFRDPLQGIQARAA